MKEPLRVLVIEDSEDDMLFVLRELKRGGFDSVSERVDAKPGMTSALERQSWDLVISDHSMPGFGSFAALELLQRKEAGHSLYRSIRCHWGRRGRAGDEGRSQ